MNKKDLLMPRYRFKRVTDISAGDLRKMGAKAVGLDIDNTIAPDGKFQYIDGIREWVKEITEAGFPITLISNGTLIRVLPVSRYLGGLPFTHMSLKPFPHALKRAARRICGFA